MKLLCCWENKKLGARPHGEQLGMLIIICVAFLVIWVPISGSMYSKGLDQYNNQPAEILQLNVSTFLGASLWTLYVENQDRTYCIFNVTTYGTFQYYVGEVIHTAFDSKNNCVLYTFDEYDSVVGFWMMIAGATVGSLSGILLCLTCYYGEYHNQLIDNSLLHSKRQVEGMAEGVV